MIVDSPIVSHHQSYIRVLTSFPVFSVAPWLAFTYFSLRCLRGSVVPAVAFKTGFFAVGFVGTLVFEMLFDVDLLEPLGHADVLFVANQTGGAVLGNVEVDLGEVITVPLLSRGNLGIGRFRGCPCLGDMLPGRPVAVDAADGFVFRAGPLFFDILVALVADRVGDEHAGARRDLLKGRCTIRAIAAHAIAVGFWHQQIAAFPCTYACQYKQCKQDPKVFCV